jgi:DNA-directed RNA polymerase specialized sigma24 family protein
MAPTNHERLKEKFRKEVCCFLLPHNSQGTALLKFIEHYINKWRIITLDPYDVLIEAIYRGMQTIEEKGKPIKKSEAWLRGACLNILRDEVKHCEKSGKLTQEMKIGHAVRTHSANPLVTAELLDQVEFLQQAYERLSSSDQDIIYQRFYLGKTYKQVQATYVRMNGQIIEASTLRKRESRALERLKAIFLDLYQANKDPAH